MLRRKSEVTFRETPTWVLARVWESSLTRPLLKWKLPVAIDIALGLLVT